MAISKQKDGGPAFPNGEGGYNAIHRGMTLRAYLAAAALKSGMSPHSHYEHALTASWCVQQADAMLAALEAQYE